jgi:hypothetical protein
LRKGTLSTRERVGAAGLTLACALAIAAPAQAQTGGTPPPGSTEPAPTTTTPTAPPGKAILTTKGKAIAPADAPYQVQAAIAAGNQIRKMPYRWGGGHASFYDSGYDCSGAVSYVLHGAGLLTSPMPSGPMASSWGSYGRGRWITAYANSSHVYMVVAGLRFDTSAVGESFRQGSGPRWRATKRKPTGYVPRYYPSL